MRSRTRQILSLILACILSVNLSIPAFGASEFPDVPASHWAYGDIRDCCRLGIVSGYTDGTFRPDQNVTGAQFVTMLARTFYGTEYSEKAVDPTYTSQGWYVPALMVYSLAGLLKGTSELAHDTVFLWRSAADLDLNRYDMAQIVSNTLTAKGREATADQRAAASLSITDYGSIPDEYREAVLNCYALEILSGFTDGSFGGSANMTRAQACVVVSRTLDTIGGAAADIAPQPTVPAQPDPTPGQPTVPAQPDPTPEQPAPAQPDPDPAPQESATKPAMAYTTDKLLYIAGVPLAGMVVIDNEYYYPLPLLFSDGSHGDIALKLNTFSYSVQTDEFFAQKSLERTWMTPAVCAKPGVEIGITEPVSRPIKASDQTVAPYKYYELKNALRSFGNPLPSDVADAGNSDYYLLRLSALPDCYGYREDGSGVYLLERLAPSAPLTWETDLAGQALKGLVKGTARETVQAIHDYLVNTLAYNQARADESVEPPPESSYYNQINKALDTGYGVCEDYAELFMAMCLRAGIPCQTTRSTWINHEWNRVYVDGKWYYIDVTWDDPVGSKPTLRQKYFLSETLWSDHEMGPS